MQFMGLQAMLIALPCLKALLTRAMAVYTPLTNEEIAALLESDYALGALSFAVGITQGVENTNYLIATTQDGKEHKYILTLFEKRVNADDLPFFMGLMAHLNSKGIACPLPIVRKSGGVISTIKGKQAVIVTFLKGRSRTQLRNAHVAALGEQVAQMHLATQDYGQTRENTLSLEGWHALYHKTKSGLDGIRHGLSEKVKDELTFLDLHLPKELPSGIIHADIFPDNVFFDEDNITGIIDFYFACADAFAYDLAIVLNAWCFEHRASFNYTKSAQLLAHYQRMRPLSLEEITAFPVLCRAAALRFLLTRAHDTIYAQTGAQVALKDPLEYVAKLEFHQSISDASAYGL